MQKGLFIEKNQNRVLRKFDFTDNDRDISHKDIYDVSSGVQVIEPPEDVDFNKIEIGDFLDEKGYRSRWKEKKRHKFVEKKNILGTKKVINKEYIQKENLSKKEKQQVKKDANMEHVKTEIFKTTDIPNEEKKELREKFNKLVKKKE